MQNNPFENRIVRALSLKLLKKMVPRYNSILRTITIKPYAFLMPAFCRPLDSTASCLEGLRSALLSIYSCYPPTFSPPALNPSCTRKLVLDLVDCQSAKLPNLPKISFLRFPSSIFLLYQLFSRFLGIFSCSRSHAPALRPKGFLGRAFL